MQGVWGGGGRGGRGGRWVGQNHLFFAGLRVGITPILGVKTLTPVVYINPNPKSDPIQNPNTNPPRVRGCAYHQSPTSARLCLSPIPHHQSPTSVRLRSSPIPHHQSPTSVRLRSSPIPHECAAALITNPPSPIPHECVAVLITNPPSHAGPVGWAHPPSPIQDSSARK